MTLAREVAEVYVNLNLTLGFALVVWLALQAGLRRTWLRHAYGVQLRALKLLLVFVAVSPVLSFFAFQVQEAVAPERSLVLSDMVVAAYLHGDIKLSAIEFERMLNLRDGWTEGVVTLASPLFTALAVALTFGLAVFVARFWLGLWRARRMVERSHLIKRIGRVDLRVSQAVRVPVAARGMWRNHVVFPYDFEAMGLDRKMALAHELQHFRNRDLEWEIGLEMLRVLFFWNPAFVLLKRQFDRLRELSCDEAVLVRRGFDPFDYAMCLLRFCERAVAGPRLGLNVGLVTRGSQVRARDDLAHRLVSLGTMGAGRRVGVAQAALFAAALTVGMALFAASIHTHKDWTHDRLMLSTVVNLERLEAINAGF
ncbi:MAG: M56 family metallopeptidase [Pseudomonadota bacterium]